MTKNKKLAIHKGPWEPDYELGFTWEDGTFAILPLCITRFTDRERGIAFGWLFFIILFKWKREITKTPITRDKHKGYEMR